MNNELTPTQLAQLRQMHAGQQRELAEVQWALDRTDARAQELRRQKAEVERGLKGTEDLLRKHDDGGAEELINEKGTVE